MKFVSYLIPLTVLLVLLSFSAYQRHSSSPTQTTNDTQQYITQLAAKCFQHWQGQEWVINRQVAQASVSFSHGIEKVCRARAELFFEGYRLSPFLDPNHQVAVFPIVYLETVEEMKNQLKHVTPRFSTI